MCTTVDVERKDHDAAESDGAKRDLVRLNALKESILFEEFVERKKKKEKTSALKKTQNNLTSKDI